MKNFGWSGHKLQFHFSYNCSNTYFQTFLTLVTYLLWNQTSPLTHIISFVIFSTLELNQSSPPPRLSSALLLSISYSCTLRLRRTPTPPLLASSFLSRPSVSVLPSRGGSSDDSGDARPRVRDSVAGNAGIIIAIIVIISQMRRAKLELCPSPSGWLTVTNSSLIHSTHQLYTGQRSPERQEVAKDPLHVSPPNCSTKADPSALCSALIINVLLQSLRAGGSLSSCL